MFGHVLLEIVIAFMHTMFVFIMLVSSHDNLNKILSSLCLFLFVLKVV